MAKFKKRTDSTPLVIAGLLFVVVLAMGSGVWFLIGGPSPYDGVDTKTFCRIDGHRSITVALVDATDPFTPEQGERLINELKRIRDNIPRFSEISIYAIDASKPDGIGSPLFQGCNPGKSKDADHVRENARIVANKFNSSFEAPFKRALVEILASKTQERSPIIESIEAATVSRFGELPANADVEKHLIIVSDMLQHTDTLSFYSKSVPTFPAFTATDAYRLHRPALGQVEVSVWEINRPAKNLTAAPVKRSEVATFWSKYFVSEGAILGSTFWDATKI
jgi:hypothetical protein